MGIFVSMLRHNSDKKTVMENKIQNNMRQYKLGNFLCNITKYDFWICGVLQIFPLFSWMILFCSVDYVQLLYNFVNKKYALCFITVA
jgi:hypothetical protein